VLDIGCGPGYTSTDIAGVVTSKGKVIAIDESARFIDHLKKRQKLLSDFTIEARLGDVQQLDLPAESMDAAYQRWVLCFVKNPEAVIRGVARALKPGGVFAIQEYMHYEGVLLAPRSTAFDRFMHIVAEVWNRKGGDSNVGLRLPDLLEKNGFRIDEIRPLHRVARSNSQFWTWPTIFINTYAPKLVEDGALTKEEHAALLRDWEAATNNPAAFFCSPPMVEIIAVKK
ncbi:MAG: methyltransferase domain-containing protein, partial [bacterium]